jgi:Capsule assembly protein Wzi
MTTKLWGLRFCLGLLLLLAPLSANASPWAEVGDNQLRSDIEILANAGVIDGATISWPLPWKSILSRLKNGRIAGKPERVQAAAARVLAEAEAATAPGTCASLSLDATNKPALVYGFDGMGRGDGTGQVSLGLNEGIFSGRLSLGGITQKFGGKPNKVDLDGTYLSARLGGVLLYGGYLDHWWGPGEISALELSNNARPMPQIGIERASTAASSWPILNLLGPWQWEFFLGKFDGPQIQSNVYYNAMHLTINPLPGLEIGASRTEEFCGKGPPCKPIADYFHFSNNNSNQDNVNDEATWEFKYSNSLAGVPFQVYVQWMNEDYSWFNHSGTSHLAGASVFLPMVDNPLKLTLEFADSISTVHPFSFGDDIYGFSYINAQFPDGMHYRGRTLGFSLDDDSQLVALQGSWTDAADRFYEVSLYHGSIGSRHSLGDNILSPTPVNFNMGEVRFTLPVRAFKLDLAGRLQDNQPRPSHGFAASGEIALRLPL